VGEGGQAFGPISTGWLITLCSASTAGLSPGGLPGGSWG